VAVAAPERVAALVLIGTKAKHDPDPALHASALTSLRDAGLDESWRTWWAPLLSPAASAEVIRAIRRIALAQSPHEVARGVTVFHTRPSRDRFLAEFPKPVVVVTGTDDPAPGRNISVAQAASAPHGRLQVVPECGHYVPLEKPRVLNAILAKIINDAATATSPPR
jgi:pimeloyl-[acyl-carrier protein] methyl ester esterase